MDTHFNFEKIQREKLNHLVINVIKIIPEQYKTEDFNIAMKKIIESSYYTAPEALIFIKIKFCNILSLMIPSLKEQWCYKIVELINNGRFDNKC